MYKSGVVIVTKGLSEKNLQTIYKYAKNCIANRLYLSVKGFSPYNEDWKYNIKACYSIANKICPELDVRLILPNSDDIGHDRDISVVLCDDLNLKYENLLHMIKFVAKSTPEILINFEGIGESIIQTPKNYESKFRKVCFGGTFDKLHNGHKILLSVSALLSHERLFCGVSGNELIGNKILPELIEPLSYRINSCLTFLNDIKPGLLYSVEQINHPFGPAADDKDFDCIIGSLETKSGCEKINEIRLQKGFPSLHIELIDLVNESMSDDITKITSDEKVSSTKNRIKLLGQQLRPSLKPYIPGKPYIIGLTGGIASGKSSISKKLESLGAHLIDCDKLGHETYTPGSEGYHKIISAFGEKIVDPKTTMINRSVLGAIVFECPGEMKKLTDIVWPLIADLVQDRITYFAELKKNSIDDKCIIVVDAAILLDAEWDKLCNEVWVTCIPRVEAIDRLKNRNKLTEAQATMRIDSQKPNNYYVESANVVFCTLWSYEFTHSQVNRTWTDLLERMNCH